MHGHGRAGRWSRRETGYPVLIAVMAAALLFSILLSLSLGVAGGAFTILLQIGGIFESDPVLGRIIFEMRMPRVLSACLTGAAFSLAGLVMQGITHNPLADSGLLGINAGAGFLIALGAVLWPSMSSLGTMLFAFLGAALAAALVYGLGISKKDIKPIRLILAGSAISALLTALSQGLALAFGLSKDLSFWTSGSLAGASWPRLTMALPWIMAAILAGMLIAGKLSVLALGEETAAGLGLKVRAVRLTGLVVVLMLAGLSVSLAGGISFLGLIISHSARFLAGSDYRRSMPVAALLGGILLVLSDLTARMINAPFDTPVGALVSLIGVPFFLVMSYRRK